MVVHARRMRYLAEDERAVIEVRRHPIVLAGPGTAALAVLVAASSIGLIMSPGSGGDFFDDFLGVIAVCFVVRFVWKLWQWSVDRVVVTDRRFLEISGVLTRKVATMPLAKVTDMTYRRTIGGRMFGYGDLIIESAGQDQALSCIDRVPRPDDFYRTVSGLATATLPEPDVTTTFTGWGTAPDEEDTGPLPRVVV